MFIYDKVVTMQTNVHKCIIKNMIVQCIKILMIISNC